MTSRLRLSGTLFVLLSLGIWVGGFDPTTPIVAQASGSIEGRVTGPGGEPIPGVSVTTIPQRGGQAQQTTTDGNGAYRLEALPENTYRVDFELRGFDGVRHNNVSMRSKTGATVDAVLHIRPICECTRVWSPARPIDGQVVDDDGHPLPHARLEVVSPYGRETALADRDGRFLLNVPVKGELPLIVADSGFATVTRQISKASAVPIVISLRYMGTQGLPDTERGNQGCDCPGFFPHPE